MAVKFKQVCLHILNDTIGCFWGVCVKFVSDNYVTVSGTSILLSIDKEKKKKSHSDITFIFLKILIYVADTYSVKVWLSVTGSICMCPGINSTLRKLT